MNPHREYREPKRLPYRRVWWRLTKITFAKYGAFTFACLAGVTLLVLYGTACTNANDAMFDDLGLAQEFSDVLEAQNEAFEQALTACEERNNE